jgi:O-antigen biosynthesis protein WbqV
MSGTHALAIGIGRFETLRAHIAAGASPRLHAALVCGDGEGLGIEVLGQARDAEHLIAARDPDSIATVVVLDPLADLAITLGSLLRLASAGRRVVRRPDAGEWLDLPSAVRANAGAVNVKTLLGRDPVPMACLDGAALVEGERVLVTGAGGSIGSEIAVMLARSGCAHLTLVDNCEHNLFSIERRIRDIAPNSPVRALLLDVRDRRHVFTAIARDKPSYVFHAAALKHVPMVEAHPSQGVLTNLIGTRNVVDACAAAGVRAMTFISTDKAVQPASVMGLTKRLAEDYVRSRDNDGAASGGARFVTVRFGNVLGTSGSVAPIFAEQIARGGPVTITHPDMERYFMSSDEAVRLTLRATALGIADVERACGLFVLEMGDPIRIIEFARRMIDAFGLAPGRDVPITVVGARPGEKLTEALVDDDEHGAQSGVAGILEVASDAVGLAPDVLARLEAAARDQDDALVLRLLDDICARRRRSAVA